MELKDDCKDLQIIRKLKDANCPVLLGHDDAWIRESLYKPGFDRYNLIAWIFSKLQFSFPSDSDGQVSSSDDKTLTFYEITYRLGLCPKNRMDVIEGTAKVNEQRTFWKLLTDILWAKLSLGTESDSCDMQSFPNVSPEYEHETKCLTDVYNCVNLDNLFNCKVQLIPLPTVKSLRAVQESTEFMDGLKDLTQTAAQDVHKDIQHASLDCSPLDDFPVFQENDISKLLEDQTSARLSSCESVERFNRYATSEFKNTYSELKPYLTSSADENHVDLGPEFRKTNLQLELISKLSNSFSSLKCATSHVMSTVRNLADSEETSKNEFQKSTFEDWAHTFNMYKK